MIVDIPHHLRPKGPTEPSPTRRSNSIRRTSTIDSLWKRGVLENRTVLGCARDLVTLDHVGDTRVVGLDELVAEVTPSRNFVSLATTPVREGLTALINSESSRYSRWQIAQVLPQDAKDGTPLFLLLDDLLGAFIVEHVAGQVWEAVDPSSLATLTQTKPSTQAKSEGRSAALRVLAGTCAGLAPGSNALNPDGTYLGPMRNTRTSSISNDVDDFGWHKLPELEGISHRRARRIDVWTHDRVVHAEAYFQDSFMHQSGAPYAAHEYVIYATADLESAVIQSIVAEPRVLPLDLCPLAASSVGRLVGYSLAEFREVVNQELAGVDGCTHMNDTLRALAEVPILVQKLQQATTS